MEEWKVVEGYSRYKVSNFGKVWDLKFDREVALQLTGKPQYYYANMNRDDGKRKLARVHILVAAAFIDNPLGLKFVDHIDQNKLNNHYSNLRWVTVGQNSRNKGNNFYVEYEGETVLMIDLLYSKYGKDPSMYRGVYNNMKKLGVDFDTAVDYWLSRIRRK